MEKIWAESPVHSDEETCRLVSQWFMSETHQLRNDFVECGSHRLWKRQEPAWWRAGIYSVFLSVCMCVSALWWTLTAGGLVFIILPVSPLMTESLSALKSSRLILILTACVTHRTHVCFPFICEEFLPHTLADFPLLETVFNHAIVRWKYYLRNVDYFYISKGGSTSSAGSSWLDVLSEKCSCGWTTQGQFTSFF